MFPTTLTTPRASFAVPPGVTSPPAAGTPASSPLLPAMGVVWLLSQNCLSNPASSLCSWLPHSPRALSSLPKVFCWLLGAQTIKLKCLFLVSSKSAHSLSQQTLGGYGLAPGVMPRTPFSSLSEHLRIRPDTKAPLEPRGFPRPSLSSCKACSVFSAGQAPTHLRTHLNITSP